MTSQRDAEGSIKLSPAEALDRPWAPRPLLDVRAEVGAYTYDTADTDEAREASLAAIADTFRLDGHPDPRAAAEVELQRRGAIASS